MSVAEIMKALDSYTTIDMPPKRVRDLIAEIYIGENWQSNRVDAIAEGEKHEKKVVAKVEAMALPDIFGRSPQVVMNSASKLMIQGQAFIEPHDSPQLQDHKRRLSRIDKYVQEFKTIDDEQFESLCAGILKELGVAKPRITPKTRDEGIDFFGQLSLESFFRPDFIEFTGAERQFSVWMIGQAKHFGDTKVSTLNIRELVGTAELARARAYSTRQEIRYLDLKMRVCDAVYCLFFTTGEMSRDTWNLLHKSGVIGMDGTMVARFLAERNIGVLNDIFDRHAFQLWYQQASTLAK